MFNERIQPNIDAGLYTRRVHRAEYPPATVLLPAGTKSTMFRIFDEKHTLIAVCHAYVLASGKIGASGMLDPKFVREGDVEYVLDPKL